MASTAASWISNRNGLSFSWCTSHHDASYQVLSQLAFWFGRGEKQKIFKMAAMLAILDFRSEWIRIYKSPRCFLPSFKSIGLLVQEKQKAKNRFSKWGHLGFRIGMILAVFDLQVTPMLPTKIQVNWPFGSGEEAKNRFLRWRPSWTSDWNEFSYFWSTSHPNASYQISRQLGFGFRRSKKNKNKNK